MIWRAPQDFGASAEAPFLSRRDAKMNIATSITVYLKDYTVPVFLVPEIELGREPINLPVGRGLLEFAMHRWRPISAAQLNDAMGHNRTHVAR